MKKRKGRNDRRYFRRRALWCAVCCLAAFAGMALYMIEDAGKVNAASETALSSRSWQSVKSVITQKLGQGYHEAGMCTGYLYWCLSNAYGVDWGDNALVSDLEDRLIDSGITKVAEGTSGELTSDMKPGDIVIFIDGTYRAHCAILGDGGKLYHASSSKGVMCGPTLQEWMAMPDASKGCDRYRIYRGLDSTGTLTLTKTSAIEDTTEDNGCYSLAGAQYGLYQGETLFGTLTTGEDGKATLGNIPYGAYTLKELTPAKGYALDLTVYDITVDAKTVTKTVKEMPQSAAVEAILYKTDREIHEGWSSENTGQYAATLQGAQYTVNYYDGYYEEDTDFSELTPVRSWILETDESGRISLDETHLVTGDPFYHTSEGQASFPLGTVTMEETKAPEGYVLDDTLHVRQITSDGTVENVTTYQNPTHEEQIIRGDLELIKVQDSSLARLGGVPFTLTSKSTGEVHTIVTDANGQASTEEIWFGNREAEDVSLGALPYDTYILDEQPCDANVGLSLIRGIEIVVYKHHAVVDLGTVTNDMINIQTTAKDQSSGTSETTATDPVTLIDSVRYEGLTAGQKYTLTGVVHRRDTGDPLTVGGAVVESTRIFTPTHSDGTVDISFTFDASSLGGEDVVIFERLYLDSQLVAVHEDINNTEQTIHIKEPVVVETVNTGDLFPWQAAAAINLLLLSGIGICGTLMKRRIKK